MQQETLQLRDIHLPPAPSFWPPAPGWWGLAFLLLALLLAGLWTFHKYRQKKRYQAHLLMLLEELEYPTKEAEFPEFLGEVSTLLRRLSVAKFGSKAVAKLHGEDWLAFLDDQSATPNSFRKGVGRLLADGPYLPRGGEAISDERLAELKELIDISRDWMMKHAGKSA